MKMTSEYVVGLYAKLENLGIKIWIDGGWAVDALLEKQTRNHEDLDIAVECNNLKKLKEYLESEGYENIERDENKMWDLVLRDNNGHEIEVHAFDFDENGNVVEEKYWDGYLKDSLSGSGIINGKTMRCVSLEQLIKTHDSTKRKLKNSDYEDMNALCEKFNFKTPISNKK